MFAIFSTVSTAACIGLAISIVLMVFFYLLLIGKIYSFGTVVFDILAVCLNQPTAIKSSTISEKCFIYSWMIGMMFFTLSYNSILLSFLTEPPVVGISSVEELAEAVQMGDYNCMITPESSFPVLFSHSEKTSLRIIGDNILQNPLGYGYIENYFRLTTENIVYIESREESEFLKGRYFISNDRFLQYLQGMATTKDFCCKEQLDIAIFRLQAGGFLQKFMLERDFRFAMETFSSESINLDHRRRIRFTDISAAFVFLILGYTISFFMLIAEIKFSH